LDLHAGSAAFNHAQARTTPFSTAPSENNLTSCDTISLDNIVGPVHLAGIGGIGMSALARLLLQTGKKVSGSDKQESPITDELKALGATIFIGHEAHNLKDAGALVVSTAIIAGNPELEEAKRRGLPVWHRSELLAYLAKDDKLIAITGTHGKTTTSAMVGQVMLNCAMDPSIVVGGIFHHIGANSRLGKGGYFVAEADESDGTHVRSKPYLSVITNIEPDHLENYPGGLNQILDVMAKFYANTKTTSIICSDDAGCRKLIDLVKDQKGCKIVTYGLRKNNLSATEHTAEHTAEHTPEHIKNPQQKQADYTYESLDGFGLRVFHYDQVLGELALKVPGEHNKLNALAAIATAVELGGQFNQASSAMTQFCGVDRRFQIIGECQGILIVDDYAHHPTEVVATLKAAKDYIRLERGKGRVVCLFQPHQPARLRDLWDEFVLAFEDADLALITDVYIARGGKLEGIDSERFVEALKHHDKHYIPGPVKALPEQLLAYLKPGDLLLTVGAGDVTNVGGELLDLLKARAIEHGRGK
jgi:UDP-N-acetylmuramate--alanine ligase